MDDTLRQLLMVAPSLVASLRGQPEAMTAFMQGYERSRQEGEQSQMRQQVTDDRQYQRGRDTAEDARRASDQTWQDTQRNVQVSGALQGAAEGADTPAQGESAIDALYRLLPPDAQATMAPSRDAALRGVAPTISRRHKAELQKLATEAEKSAFVQQADDAGQDPEFADASPRMRALMTELTGKPVFRLSDLRQAAELLKPAGKERMPAPPGSAAEYSDPKTTPARKAQILKDRLAFQTVDDRPPSSAMGGTNLNDSDTTTIAQQLVDGTLVPSMLMKRGNFNQILAMADRLSRTQTGKAYNASKAQTEFGAAQRFVSSMNSTQQNRFKALAVSVVNTIDEVNLLASDLKNSGVPLANRVKMEAFVQTAGNSEMGQKVSQYLGAVNALKEEFANLAQGGYAPTEAAWTLANKQINENYGVDQLKASLVEVQRLINFRMQAFDALTPYGVSPTNPVMPQGAPPASPPPSTPARKYYGLDGKEIRKP